ncbi:acyltransferase [bacterium]|nr:acyltransferase [bacterium]
MSQSSSSRNFGLDLLRACAIFLVIGSHATYTVTQSNFFLATLSHCLGAWGVELFFVLSGYLIGQVLLKILDKAPVLDGRTLGHFYVRRWLRTLPNYYLVLALALWLYASSTGGLPRGWESYLTFTQNLLDSRVGFFGHSWSLAVEEWFYLLFPLVLFSLARFFSRRQALWTTLALFLLVPLLCRWALASQLGASPFRMLQKAALLRLDSIIYGVCGAACARYFPGTWVSLRRFGWAPAFAMLLILGLGFHASLEMRGAWAAVWVFPLTSIAFLLLVPRAETLARPAVKAVEQLVTWVSLTSYSAYLLHPIFQVEFARLFNAAYTLPLAAVVKPVSWFVFIGAASWLLYRYFESPILRWRDRVAA